MKFPDLTGALKNVLYLVDWGGDELNNDIDNEKAVASLLSKLDKYGRDQRREHERVWYMNAAYAMGNHYVKWNDTTRQIERIPAPPHRVRLTVNYIAPALLRDQAKILRLRPKPEVVPINSEYQAIRKARTAQLILNAKHEQAELDTFMQKVIFTAQIYGHAFIKVFFNPELGEVYQEEDDEGNVEQYFEGDVDFDIDNPTTLFWEPDCGGIRNASWALSVKTKTKGWAVDKFPDIEKKIAQSEADEQPDGIWQKMRRLFGFGQKRTDNNVVVKEFWLRPKPNAKDEWRRKGCFILMVNDIVAKGPEPFPYHNGKLPWVELNDAYLHGLSEYGPTKTAQLLPSINVYERLQSNMLENIIMTVRQTMLVPRGSGVDVKEITGEPGQIITYKETVGRSKPEYLRTPEPNHHSYDSLANRQMADFENISGQHEVSRGISPSSDSSGRAIEALQYADDTMLKTFADQYRRALCDMYERILELYKQFSAKDKRAMVLYGKNIDEHQILEFTGDDLEWRAIRIEPTSLKPSSPWALRQMVLQLLQVGAFGPFQNEDHKQAVMKALRSLEWGSFSELFEEATDDDQKADWENDQLDQVTEVTTELIDETNPDAGERQVPVFPEDMEPVIPTPYDDDEAHLRRHRMRQKKLSFLALPKAARLAHLHHCEEHEQNMVVKAEQMRQLRGALTAAGVLSPTDPQMAMEAMPEENIKAAINSVPPPPMGGASEAGPPPTAVMGDNE